MNLVPRARDLLDEAIREHRPDYIVAMFSGGHDSAAALHLATASVDVRFACHIDTGIGIPETREYVAKVCSVIGIGLQVYRADEYVRADGTPDPQNYRSLVLERGFPGPAMHTKMFNRLKERPIRQMIRDLKQSRKERVLLVSGLRKGESARRRRYRSPMQNWEGTKMWVAPLWEFDKLAVTRYLEEVGLPRSPVVDLIHKSGECLCGAFAKPGEKQELQMWFPEVAAQIERLEDEVRSRGFAWGWGERPHSRSSGEGGVPEGVMCTSCSQSATNFKAHNDTSTENL